MDSARTALRFSALAITALALAGCFGTGLSPSGTAVQPTPARPPVSMAGRWLLASPGLGQCHMTFGAAAASAEGTIAPEGGCPGQFYTSRKWAFDSTGLAIRNHNGEPLAQLSPGGGQFTGQSTSGEAITLSR